MTHADLPGGWRAITLAEAVRGERTIDSALHLVGIRGTGAHASKARQDLTDAGTAYLNGDVATALAVARDLAEDTKNTRGPGRRRTAA